jgi:hypothetical protein
MRWTERLLLRMGTVGALLAMLQRGGRWWMLPLIVGFLFVAAALIFLQSAHYVAPFIYMIF